MSPRPDASRHRHRLGDWRRHLVTLRGTLDRVLFRVGPPEPAPIVLGQRRIYVLPTPAGLAFAAALLVMLIASINYNLSLGYALVFLLGGVSVASIVHAFRNLLHLSFSPGRAEPVFAGDRASFHVIVANHRHARRPSLRLGAHGAVVRFEIDAEDRADVTIPVATSARGRMALGRVRIETTYPLGLIRAWSVLIPDQHCLVYPAPEPSPPPLPEGPSSKSGRRVGSAGEDDFAGLRRHQPADSPRHVAWKTLARGGPMLTKQFAGMDGGQIHLDWNDLPADLGTEARLSRMTAWIVAAERRGLAFSLTLPAAKVSPGQGSEHGANCLRHLALFGTEGPADA